MVLDHSRREIVKRSNVSAHGSKMVGSCHTLREVCLLTRSCNQIITIRNLLCYRRSTFTDEPTELQYERMHLTPDTGDKRRKELALQTEQDGSKMGKKMYESNEEGDKTWQQFASMH